MRYYDDIFYKLIAQFQWSNNWHLRKKSKSMHDEKLF